MSQSIGKYWLLPMGGVCKSGSLQGPYIGIPARPVEKYVMSTGQGP